MYAGDDKMAIKNNSNNNCEDCKKSKEPCPCGCEQICVCKCDKLSYNSHNCCYLQPRDICIVQVKDYKLLQIITNNQNLYLTSVPLEINTSSYEIQSSVIQRPNDTLVVNESGVYSIYVSLKYSFKFNESANLGDICKIRFKIGGNNKEIFTIDNTLVVPSIIDGESEEITNTIQGSALQVIEENLPFKINLNIEEFEFSRAVLNQIIISDLILIVEKII